LSKRIFYRLIYTLQTPNTHGRYQRGGHRSRAVVPSLSRRGHDGRGGGGPTSCRNSVPPSGVQRQSRGKGQGYSASGRGQGGQGSGVRGQGSGVRGHGVRASSGYMGTSGRHGVTASVRRQGTWVRRQGVVRGTWSRVVRRHGVAASGWYSRR
jgi:hypothetical protein